MLHAESVDVLSDLLDFSDKIYVSGDVLEETEVQQSKFRVEPILFDPEHWDPKVDWEVLMTLISPTDRKSGRAENEWMDEKQGERIKEGKMNVWGRKRMNEGKERELINK